MDRFDLVPQSFLGAATPFIASMGLLLTALAVAQQLRLLARKRATLRRFAARFDAPEEGPLGPGHVVLAGRIEVLDERGAPAIVVRTARAKDGISGPSGEDRLVELRPFVLVLNGTGERVQIDAGEQEVVLHTRDRATVAPAGRGDGHDDVDTLSLRDGEQVLVEGRLVHESGGGSSPLRSQAAILAANDLGVLHIVTRGEIATAARLPSNERPLLVAQALAVAVILGSLAWRTAVQVMSVDAVARVTVVRDEQVRGKHGPFTVRTFDAEWETAAGTTLQCTHLSRRFDGSAGDLHEGDRVRLSYLPAYPPVCEVHGARLLDFYSGTAVIVATLFLGVVLIVSLFEVPPFMWWAAMWGRALYGSRRR